DRQNWPQTMEIFSYLKGLDGRGSSTGEAAATGEANSEGAGGAGKEQPKEADSKPRQPSDTIVPDGPAQFDYIQRLGERLELRDEELHREKNTRIKAIGVVGSDVYDKLLILRELRNRFHDAVFFTTDLDDRLMSPSEWDWTRNLVVASNF